MKIAGFMVLVAVIVFIIDTLIFGCGASTTVKEGAEIIEYGHALDYCETVARTAYRDSGREVGLSEFHACERESGL